jgi:hypothetical protein
MTDSHYINGKVLYTREHVEKLEEALREARECLESIEGGPGCDYPHEEWALEALAKIKEIMGEE